MRFVYSKNEMLLCLQIAADIWSGEVLCFLWRMDWILKSQILFRRNSGFKLSTEEDLPVLFPSSSTRPATWPTFLKPCPPIVSTTCPSSHVRSFKKLCIAFEDVIRKLLQFSADDLLTYNYLELCNASLPYFLLKETLSYSFKFSVTLCKTQVEKDPIVFLRLHT